MNDATLESRALPAGDASAAGRSVVTGMAALERWWPWLTAALGVSCLIALVRVWLAPGFYVDVDAANLIEPAQRWAEDGELAISTQFYLTELGREKLMVHMPLHYWLTGVAFEVFGISFTVMRAVSLIEGALAAAVAVSIARRLGGGFAGFLTLAGLSAALPALAPAMLHPRPDMACLLFGLLAIRWVIVGQERLAEPGATRARRWLPFALAGLASGASLFSHGNGIIFVAWGFAMTVYHVVRRRWSFSAFAAAAVGAMIPLALYAAWWGPDLPWFLESIRDIYYGRGGSTATFQRGPQFVAAADLGLLSYLYQCLQVEMHFRLATLMRMLGRFLVLAPIVGAIFFIVRARKNRRPDDALLVSAIVFIGLFLVFARPNKTLAYTWLMYVPLVIATATLVARIFRRAAAAPDDAAGRTARVLANPVSGLVVTAGLFLVCASLNFTYASGSVALHAQYAEYDAYAELILGTAQRSTGREDPAILGDSRLSFALRDANFTPSTYAFERGRMLERPFDDLREYDFIQLTEDLNRRLESSGARRVLFDHFDFIGTVTVVPYGRSELYRRKGMSGEPVGALDVIVRGGNIYRSSEPRALDSVTPKAWEAIAGATVTPGAGSTAEIVTTAAANAYQARVEVDPDGGEQMQFVVDVEVASGGGALGVLDQTQSRWLANVPFHGEGPHRVSGVCNVTGQTKVYFVLQNHPQPTASKFTIGELRLTVTALELVAGQ